MNDFNLSSIRDTEIFSHYQNFLGKPDAVFKFNKPNILPTPIFVCEFARNTDDENESYWVYTTIGMSRQDMPGAQKYKVNPRIELVLYSDKRSKQLSEFLFAMSIYPFLKQTVFAIGDIYTGQEPILDESPDLCNGLFTYPYFEPEAFPIIHHQDHTHTVMTMFVPLYSSERQFIRDNGWQALENLFRENEADTIDFHRSPVA